MIRTENLIKIYKNGLKAVDGLNLRVDEGDVFGFLGPNGAGKTTTIRMLDGLLAPTSGRAFISGMDVAERRIEIKRIIGVVPESHGYYYFMTAREYLSYFSSLFDAKKDNGKYIEELLERVGLSDKTDVAVGRYSRGMKQRLGIAKSLINRPRVIFLDEPTLGLDPKGQRDIERLLLEINKSDKITIFITSHLLKDIETMCNKVCIVKNGVLTEQGSVAQLREKYTADYTILLNTSDNGEALRILTEDPDIRDVRPGDGGLLEIKLKSGLPDYKAKAAKRRIIAELYGARIDIEEMTRKTLTMEDIFFCATEGESK